MACIFWGSKGCDSSGPQCQPQEYLFGLESSSKQGRGNPSRAHHKVIKTDPKGKRYYTIFCPSPILWFALVFINNITCPCLFKASTFVFICFFVVLAIVPNRTFYDYGYFTIAKLLSSFVAKFSAYPFFLQFSVADVVDLVFC